MINAPERSAHSIESSCLVTITHLFVKFRENIFVRYVIARCGNQCKPNAVTDSANGAWRSLWKGNLSRPEPSADSHIVVSVQQLWYFPFNSCVRQCTEDNPTYKIRSIGDFSERNRRIAALVITSWQRIKLLSNETTMFKFKQNEASIMIRNLLK